MTPKAAKNTHPKGFPALAGNGNPELKNWTTLSEYVSQITSDEALASQLDFRTGDLILTQDTLKKIAKRRRKLLKAKFEGLPEAVASPLMCNEYEKREHILRKEVTSYQALLNDMEQTIARQLHGELLHEIAMNLQQVQSDERIAREDILAEQELELVTTEADFFTTAPTLVLQASNNSGEYPASSLAQPNAAGSVPSSRQSRKQSTPRTGQPRQPTPSFAPTPPLESNLSTSRRTSGRESNSSRSTARRAARKEEQSQLRLKQDEEETEKRVFEEN
jgi:hypothetical protein